MATKRKTAAEIREEEIVREQTELMEEEAAEETEPAEDAKDAEIASLKKQLAKMAAENAREVFVPNGRGDMERLMRVAQDAEESKTDPWKVFVNVRVPRKMGAGDDDFWVAVNGRTAQIPANGQVQEMKLPFAMALMDALEAEEKAIEFAEGLKMYDPINSPKP